MMYTSEMRALTPEDLRRELEREAECRKARNALPLNRR
jgi:hypothetical protein